MAVTISFVLWYIYIFRSLMMSHKWDIWDTLYIYLHSFFLCLLLLGQHCQHVQNPATWHDMATRQGCIPTEVSFESFETCPCQEGKSHENQEDFFKGASLFFVNHSNDINKFSPPKKKSLGLRGTQLVDHCKGFKQRIFFFIGSMGFVISIPIHERLISMGNYMKLLGFN